MARLRTAGVALAIATLSLSGCGVGGAVTDARHACVHIKAALALETQSEAKGLSATVRNQFKTKALTELLKATPLAAAATSADGTWNPLQTTLQEANRVPLQYEAPALTRLCQIANSSTPIL